MKPAAVLLAALVLALASCGDDAADDTTSAPDTTSAGGGEVVFPSNCTSGTAPEPASVVVTCADAGISVSEVDWSTWGGETAKGEGTAHVNDCDPDCVAGEITTRDGAQLTLSAIESCGSTQQYTRLTLSFEGKPPPGAAKSSRQHFPCA